MEGITESKAYTTQFTADEPRKRIIKNKYVVSVLSFILPGLGQIYLGRVRRGVGFMFIPSLVALTLAITIFLFDTLFTIDLMIPPIGLLTLYFLLISYFLFPLSWIASIKDAYDIASEI
ncbi:MAG: hypothetical protein JSW11_21285 [Candidatus Heimdallarchaeota archaeon]|nr:MAG: hypothetical protein JSW11_21285 [Candidatus Heimdallarchaeota archaeon]